MNLVPDDAEKSVEFGFNGVKKLLTDEFVRDTALLRIKVEFLNKKITLTLLF